MSETQTSDSATPHSAEPTNLGAGNAVSVAKHPNGGATSEVWSLIERLALNPQTNVETIERMMALHNKMVDEQKRAAFSADYVAMKPHLPLIVKEHLNTQTNSRYAKLEDINKVIDPILEQYHFATASKVVSQTDNLITVRCELWHNLGHVEATELSMPPDDQGIAGKVNKTRPHAIASTITYLKRVGFCALLNISTGDDVDGNLPSATITEEQVAQLLPMVKRARADWRWLKYMKLTAVA